MERGEIQGKRRLSENSNASLALSKERQICPGASLYDGEISRADAYSERGSSSYKRSERRQQIRESGNPSEEASRWNSAMPLLSKGVSSEIKCPRCGSVNIEVSQGTVLDPMCGSGTTCLVAKKLGRNYIGIEINPAYVEMARKRLSKIPDKLDKYVTQK